MKLFAAPKTEYKNYYDQSRFNLVWRMNLMFIFLMLVVIIKDLWNPHAVMYTKLISIGIGVSALLVLLKLRKHELISAFLTISGTLIIATSFFLVKNSIHFSVPMWMVMNIILAFFCLGRKWGLTILSVNFTVVIAYFFLLFEENVKNAPEITQQDIIGYSLDYLICGLGTAYLLFQFVKVNKHAEDKYKLSNEALNEQNTVITQQNDEKAIMLKEIHHRVKNNLQIITSLLRLQSADMEEGASLDKFTEAITRVKAMALIHEKMYQSNEFSKFDLSSYIASLSMDLIHSYSVHRHVEMKTWSNLTKIGSKTIVPIALLSNELITNSLKHAFDDIENPIITLTFKEIDDSQFELTYEDNGRWKESNKNSFGTELIFGMTEQLDGQVDLIKTDQGTTYKFVLKNIDEPFSS